MTEIGDPFPDFVLPDENGELFNNKDLSGVRYVIYFYSRDGTAGCTKEAQEFTVNFANFMLRNVPIIGVSKDTPESHRRFIDKNGLKIKLLSDTDHKLMEKMGIWGTKMMYGKETQGVVRSTYVVGKDGKIEAQWIKVKVDGHAQAVLDKVKVLSRR